MSGTQNTAIGGYLIGYDMAGFNNSIFGGDST